MHGVCHQVCLDRRSLNTKRLSHYSRSKRVGGVVPGLGLAVSLLGRPLQHRHAIRVRCGFWRWIVTAEQSGLLTHIAATESVSLRWHRRIARLLAATLEWPRGAVHIVRFL